MGTGYTYDVGCARAVRPTAQPFCWGEGRGPGLTRQITCGSLLLVLLASGCGWTPLKEGVRASAQIERKQELVAGRYTLEPPDVIEISVVGEKDLTVQSTIQPDGYASVPFGGQLYLAGLTVEEAQQLIGEKLSAVMRKPEVVVQIAQFNSHRVFLVGELTAPGAVPYYGNLSVVQAVSTAGGVTTRAAKNRARLVRYSADEKQLFKIKYKNIVRGKSDRSNLLMRDGDILYVPPTRMVAAGYAIENFLYPVRSVMNTLFSGFNFFAR